MSKDIIFRCDSDGCPKGNFVFRNVSKEGEEVCCKACCERCVGRSK